jgi:hypothetical protein
MSNIFLSHSHADKRFARKIANDLMAFGHKVWIDEAELKIGDSLIEKIATGLFEVDYVAAIISSHSIKSNWVSKELTIASTREINEKRVVVLPILIERVELPGFLVDKFYGVFINKRLYKRQFDLLLRTLRTSYPTEKQFQNTREKGEELAETLQQVINQYRLPSGILVNKPHAEDFSVEADIEVNAIWALGQYFHKSTTAVSPAHLIALAKNVLSAGLPESKLMDGYKLSELLLALRTSPGIPDKLINDLWQLIRTHYISTSPIGELFLISDPTQPQSLSWANAYLLLALTLGAENRAPDGALEVAKQLERNIASYLAKGEGIFRARWFDQPEIGLIAEVKAFGNALYGVGLIALAKSTLITDYERRSVASVDTISNLLSKTLWDFEADLPSRSEEEQTRRLRALSAVLFFMSEYLSYKLRGGQTSSGGPVFSDPKLALVWNRMNRLLAVHNEIVKNDARGLPSAVSDSLEARGDYEGLTQAYAYLSAASVSKLRSSIITMR